MTWISTKIERFVASKTSHLSKKFHKNTSTSRVICCCPTVVKISYPHCDSDHHQKAGWLVGSCLTAPSAQMGHIMPWTFQICRLGLGTNTQQQTKNTHSSTCPSWRPWLARGVTKAAFLANPLASTDNLTRTTETQHTKIKIISTLKVSLIMRPSSLGGGHILRRTLSVRPVRPVMERHLAPPSELQWHTEGRITYGHLGRTNL